MAFWAALAAGAKTIGLAALKAAPKIGKGLEIMGALRSASDAAGGRATPGGDRMSILGKAFGQLRPESDEGIGTEMTSKVLEESLRSARKTDFSKITTPLDTNLRFTW